MSTDVSRDELVLIRIEGMHCHTCEQTIRKVLQRLAGVHEVEVDFNSGQASVLYDREQVSVSSLVEAVTAVGYHITGFTQRQVEAGP